MWRNVADFQSQFSSGVRVRIVPLGAGSPFAKVHLGLLHAVSKTSASTASEIRAIR